MVTFMEEVLSKIFKPLLIALGGWLVIAIYNRVMFWKRCKYYLGIQKKINSVREHYISYLYCHGYNSHLNGRRLTLKQRITDIDYSLLEELKSNLSRCSWTFGRRKHIANNVVKQIDLYVKIHKEALENLERGSDLSGVSKQLLDMHLCICHFFETLLEGKPLEDGNIVSTRYKKHNLEMGITKIPRFYKGYKVYIDNVVYE